MVTIKEVTGTIERLLLPRLSTIEGEIKALQSEIGRLDDKIEERTRSIQTEIASLRNEIKNLSEKMDLVKDVEYLKIKVAALEEKK
jgi:predicted  nucleic acid-binding Zn-ribbon protein